MKVHLLGWCDFDNLGAIKKALTIINAFLKYNEKNKSLRKPRYQQLISFIIF